MKNWAVPLLIGAFVSSCVSLSAHRGTIDPLAVAADIKQLEESWTTAFNSRDTDFMQRTLAPEFVVVASGGTQGINITLRKDWMKVWLGPEHHPYEAKTLHVAVAGDTAVATLEASWRRKSYLTDTWMRRNGRWQLVHRHSASR